MPQHVPTVSGNNERPADFSQVADDENNVYVFQLQHGDNLLAMDSIKGCEIDLKEQGKLLR